MIYYEVEAIMNKREMIVFMKSYVVIAMIIIILIFEIIIVNIVKRLIEASRKSNIIIADIKSFYKMSGRPTLYKFDIEFEGVFYQTMYLCVNENRYIKDTLGIVRQTFQTI